MPGTTGRGLPTPSLRVVVRRAYGRWSTRCWRTASPATEDVSVRRVQTPDGRPDR